VVEVVKKLICAKKFYTPSTAVFIKSGTKAGFMLRNSVLHYLRLRTVTFFPEALRSLYNLSSAIGYESRRVSSVDLAINLENGVLFAD
jgi:hypothetical protein